MSDILPINYISASEARKRLSSLVRRVISGESFIITDDKTGEPIAELVSVADKDEGSITQETEM
ncbi:MAG: type II toxin-antitoxin system prevent-host-death family antitoxin [Pyrinomonadaceae bacterium]